MEIVDAHTALFLLKNCLSVPKLTYFLRSAPCFLWPDILKRYDLIINEALEDLTNVALTGDCAAQARLPVKLGGLGIPCVSDPAPSAYLSSVSASSNLVCSLLAGALPGHESTSLRHDYGRILEAQRNGRESLGEPVSSRQDYGRILEAQRNGRGTRGALTGIPISSPPPRRGLSGDRQ